MSDDTETREGSGGQAVPAAETNAAPNMDAGTQDPPAPAATPEDEAKQKADAEKAEAEKAERKKNRTREYIAKLNRERAELAAKVAEYEQRSKSTTAAPPQADGKPTLEQYDFDQNKYLEALADWKVEQRLKAHEDETKKTEGTQRQQEIEATYNTKVADFIDDHPDFPEVVNSIRYPLPPEVQSAVMAHDKGPEIAYHLGTNDDDAFQLASIQPHLAAAAVDRLASRLTAAHEAPHTPATPKPVSQTPTPAPTVSGRSPTETPPEKLTDAEWFKRQQEKRRAK